MNHLKQGERQVLFDHDGSADDFLSLILLLSMKHINVLGVSITPADCFVENALETTLKILSLTGKSGLAVGTNDFNGINSFPAEWRAKPKILNAFPCLINIDTSGIPTEEQGSREMIAQKILSADVPVTVLMTGPCSSLVQAIEYDSKVLDKIEEVVWMAGAIDVAGNVRTYNHDNSAEWNVFWDPISSRKLLQYQLPLTMVPLDVTNNVPVTIDFLKNLALQSSHFYSSLASQFWAITIDTIPSYEYTYFMWDVLATSYLAIPQAFTIEKVELGIVPKGANAGQTFRKPGSNQWVNVATNVDKACFYDYLLNQFRNFQSDNR